MMCMNPERAYSGKVGICLPSAPRIVLFHHRPHEALIGVIKRMQVGDVPFEGLVVCEGRVLLDGPEGSHNGVLGGGGLSLWCH